MAIRKRPQPVSTELPFGHPRRERDAAILAYFLVVAQHQKAWADKTKNDAKWIKGACQMSLDMLRDHCAKTVNELAWYAYDYWSYRAALTYNPYGGPQVQKTDPHASNMWDALKEGDPSMLFKHYGVEVTTKRAEKVA